MLPMVGLTGVARVGKNFVGNRIYDKYGFFPWSFAHALKARVYATSKNNWNLEQLFGQEDKPPELRRELQQEGTELGRDIYGDNIWIKHVEAFLYTAEHDWNIPGVVLTDVRFHNEANLIRTNGGLMLRVNRREAGLSGEAGLHRSERHIPNLTVDGIIDNNGQSRNTYFASLNRIDAQIDLYMLPYLKRKGLNFEQKTAIGAN